MKKWAVIAVAASIAIACSAGLYGCSSGGPAPTVFDVTWCSHDGTVRVSTHAPIIVLFNDALVGQSVNANGIDLRPLQAEPITCHLTLDGLALTIRPDDPLDSNRDYRLTLGITLEGESLGALPAPVEFDFSTQVYASSLLDVPPFGVVRHGVTMHGLWADENGSIAVGDHGVALLGTDRGRFTVPIPVYPEIDLVSLRDVWVAEPGSAYVAGSVRLYGLDRGYIFRFEDGVLTLDRPNTGDHVFAVHGTSPDTAVVATGERTWIRNLDERSDGWSPYPSTTAPPLDSLVVDVWADPLPAFYAAGAQGVHRGIPDGFLVRWELAFPTPVPCTAISGLDAYDIVGIALDSTTWLHHEQRDFIRRQGFAWTDICWADEAWAVQVGKDSTSAYSVLFDDPLVDHHGRDRRIETTEELRAVAAWTVDDDKYAICVGDAGVEFQLKDELADFNDGNWTVDTLNKRDAQGEIPDWTDLSGAFDAQNPALYAIRGGEVVEFDFSLAELAWSVLPPPGNLVPHHLSCLAEDDIWITGIADGQMDWFAAHYDGSEWTNHWFSSMDTPRDIFVADRGNLFIACDHGTVYGSGGYWAPMSAVSPPQHLYGIWGTSADSVWVCGAKGTIAHAETTAPLTWIWTQEALDAVTDANLRAIHGTDENNIVVAGDDCTVLQYDGSNWTDISPPPELEVTDVDLTMVWTSSPDQIWVASPDHTVLHYDETKWIKWNTGIPTGALNAMWGGNSVTDGGLWLGGDDDLLLRQADPPPVLPLIDR